MNFHKLKTGARDLVILIMVSGLWAFADWPQLEYDPTNNWFQPEGAGVMDTTPKILWSWTHPFADTGFFAVGDLDGDNINDVVAVFGYDSMIYAFRGNDGSLLWQVPYPKSEGKKSEGKWLYAENIPAIGDLDGDGRNEIYFSYMPMVSYDFSFALNGEDGSLLWKKDTTVSEVLLIDSDGDGKMEVLGKRALWDRPLRLLSGSDGSLIWEFSVEGWWYVALPDPLWPKCYFFADLDGDGNKEIGAIGEAEQNSLPAIYVIDPLTGQGIDTCFLDLQPDPSNTYVILASPIAVDLDGEPGKEIIIYYDNYNSNCYAYTDAFKWGPFGLQRLWRNCDSVYSDYRRSGWLAAADLDGNGTVEVCVGASIGGDGMTQIIHGNNGQTFKWGLGYPLIGNLTSHSGLEILGVAPRGYLGRISGDSLILVWASDSVIGELAAIADMDGDGHNEIVGMTWRHGTLWVFDSVGGTEIAENPIPVPQEPLLLYRDGKPFLSFPRGAPEGTMIRAYDVKGALIQELRPEPGSREIGFEMPRVGVYFLQIETKARRFLEKAFGK